MKWPSTISCAAPIFAAFATACSAQDHLTLSSAEVEDGGALPSELKCTHDGGTVEGRDAPSHYWLLWDIPMDTREIERGNPQSIGHEGVDKDRRRMGYTPPCSPPGARHKYTISLYALDEPLDALPDADGPSVDWAAMTAAMEGHVIASSQISFYN